MDRKIDRQTNRWTDGCKDIHPCVHVSYRTPRRPFGDAAQKQMDGHLDGRLNKQMDDKQINRLMDEMAD